MTVSTFLKLFRKYKVCNKFDTTSIVIREKMIRSKKQNTKLFIPTLNVLTYKYHDSLAKKTKDNTHGQ